MKIDTRDLLIESRLMFTDVPAQTRLIFYGRISKSKDPDKEKHLTSGTCSYKRPYRQ